MVLGRCAMSAFKGAPRQWGTVRAPEPTCGFENCRDARSRHDLRSLENDQNKTHYRQRGSSHRRCHAWIR